MFVIKDKATGLYYTNKARFTGGKWTTDINDCKPFRSASGAKNSRCARREQRIYLTESEQAAINYYANRDHGVVGQGRYAHGPVTVRMEDGRAYYLVPVPFDEYLELVPVGITQS